MKFAKTQTNETHSWNPAPNLTSIVSFFLLFTFQEGTQRVAATFCFGFPHSALQTGAQHGAVVRWGARLVDDAHGWHKIKLDLWARMEIRHIIFYSNRPVLR